MPAEDGRLTVTRALADFELSKTEVAVTIRTPAVSLSPMMRTPADVTRVSGSLAPDTCQVTSDGGSYSPVTAAVKARFSPGCPSVSAGVTVTPRRYGLRLSMRTCSAMPASPTICVRPD